MLVEAIGTEEYGGRVRGIESGVDLRIFFGSSPKNNEVVHKKEIEDLVDQRVVRGYKKHLKMNGRG